MLTPEQLDSRLNTYTAAMSRREGRVLRGFAVMMAPIVLMGVAFGTDAVPRPVLGTIAYSWLAALGIFAIGVVVTGFRFDRTFGVYCPDCHSSLLRLSMEFEDEDRAPRDPNNMRCPECGALVAGRAA